ncbi:hypothetical protein P3S68_021371 [Capsicum galapagoense]
MERAGLKTLQSVASPLHFRASLHCSLHFYYPKWCCTISIPLTYIPLHVYLHSILYVCIRSDAKTLPNGAECGDAAAQHKLLQVVLVSPQGRYAS